MGRDTQRQAIHEVLGNAGAMPTQKELEKQQLWIPPQIFKKDIQGKTMIWRPSPKRLEFGSCVKQ